MKMNKPSDCKWANSCNCKGAKTKFCLKCKWYYFIDTGYGYCKALPEHIVVAWCRDICSLFKFKEKEDV